MSDLARLCCDTAMAATWETVRWFEDQRTPHEILQPPRPKVYSRLGIPHPQLQLGGSRLRECPGSPRSLKGMGLSEHVSWPGRGGLRQGGGLGRTAPSARGWRLAVRPRFGLARCSPQDLTGRAVPAGFLTLTH